MYHRLLWRSAAQALGHAVIVQPGYMHFLGVKFCRW